MKEWNKEETEPGLPDWEVDTMYGESDCPSKRADDAFPNEVSESTPETIKTRSGSMTPLLSWVFWRGTMVNWETSVVPSREDPCKACQYD